MRRTMLAAVVLVAACGAQPMPRQLGSIGEQLSLSVEPVVIEFETPRREPMLRQMSVASLSSRPEAFPELDAAPVARLSGQLRNSAEIEKGLSISDPLPPLPEPAALTPQLRQAAPSRLLSAEAMTLPAEWIP